jgi:glycerophosphoryl diester phosphodiesterase
MFVIPSDILNICDYTMDELRLLDIGYGYTADHGNTYPFRGRGIGLMPELGEVLEAFSDRELLIHMRQWGMEDAKVLWTYLEKMPEERLKKISVYGIGGIQYLREQYPTLNDFHSKTNFLPLAEIPAYLRLCN